MSGNTFGTLFSFTSFGESHGPAIGCVVDGCPPGLALAEADIQHRARPPPAGHVAARDAAPRVRHRRDPVRRVRGPHDGHADRAPDPQRGPAQQGLREHRGHVPPRPRRLHVLAEVRHPRLPRRRAAVRARDRRARRRGRHREEVAARALRRRDPRPHDAPRTQRRPVRGLGARRRQSVLRRERGDRPRARGVHGPAAQVRRLVRRAHRGRRDRRAGRAGASPSTASSTPISRRR